MAHPQNYVVTVKNGVERLNLPTHYKPFSAGDEVELSPQQFVQMAPTQMAAVTVTQVPDDGTMTTEEWNSLATEEEVAAALAAVDTKSDAGDAALSEALADKQDAATAATDAEVAAAIAAIPTPDMSSKQDAATAATDEELAAAVAASTSPFKMNATNDAIIPVDNNDSWIVGSDRFAWHATESPNTKRAWFDKIKGAFRAGSASTQWDAANVGVNSVAIGSYCKASGEGSVALGHNAVASAQYSVAIGYAPTATAQFSCAVNQASAEATHSFATGTSTTRGSQSVAEGSSCYSYGSYSHAEGFYTHTEGDCSHGGGNQAKAARYGEWARAAGKWDTQGDAQMGAMTLRATTADATTKLMIAANSLPVTPAAVLTGSTTNVLTVVAKRNFMLKVSVVATRPDAGGETMGTTWEGVVARGATGSARFVGTPTVARWGDDATAPWTVAISLNTANATSNYVAIHITGEAAKNIRWVAKMEWVEVGG